MSLPYPFDPCDQSLFWHFEISLPLFTDTRRPFPSPNGAKTGQPRGNARGSGGHDDESNPERATHFCAPCCAPCAVQCFALAGHGRSQRPDTRGIAPDCHVGPLRGQEWARRVAWPARLRRGHDLGCFTNLALMTAWAGRPPQSEHWWLELRRGCGSGGAVCAGFGVLVIGPPGLGAWMALHSLQMHI
jgi:hypothetical protein